MIRSDTINALHDLHHTPAPSDVMIDDVALLIADDIRDAIGTALPISLKFAEWGRLKAILQSEMVNVLAKMTSTDFP